ncbi:hypothetical protein IWZ03DRAFT_187988 [Phyllosticta citriasiana]|uniref:Secreted protein n=1 Tax=Phyllosticta citriasiana TaxID=595635 RepID=A0ABR1KM59_9PEZI
MCGGLGIFVLFYLSVCLSVDLLACHDSFLLFSSRLLSIPFHLSDLAFHFSQAPFGIKSSCLLRTPQMHAYMRRGIPWSLLPCLFLAVGILRVEDAMHVCVVDFAVTLDLVDVGVPTYPPTCLSVYLPLPHTLLEAANERATERLTD